MDAQQDATRFWQAQIEPTLGDLATNLDQHLAAISEAADAGAEVVLFPELSLTGYFLKDQTSDVARKDYQTARSLKEELGAGASSAASGSPKALRTGSMGAPSHMKMGVWRSSSSAASTGAA